MRIVVLGNIDERALKQEEAKNKVYKGIHHYIDYGARFRREQTLAAKLAQRSLGPLGPSAHIRITSRFDFQLDICKDYKETGYCGYGDSCKFMHDRGDYKSGWQLEKEWEHVEKARKRNFRYKGIAICEEVDDRDSLPSACSICRNSFVDPVVTNCKHYFCGHCALKHHSSNKKCFVCNQPTQGTFNTAHKICKMGMRAPDER